MHRYIIEQDKEKNRDRIQYACVLLSIVGTYYGNRFISFLSESPKSCVFFKGLFSFLSFWLISYTISFATTYKIASWIMNKMLFEPFAKLIGVPIFKGKWQGTLSPSTEHPPIFMTLNIKQTLLKVSCESHYKQKESDEEESSSSGSYMARVFIRNGVPKLEFSYENQGNNPDWTCRVFQGFCSFQMESDSLVGEYYTNRVGEDGKNLTHGKMHLKRC